VNRRRFVQVVGAAGLALAAGCGQLAGQVPQPSKLPRVGVLLPFAADSAQSLELLEPFRAGLRELGYIEGQNIGVE
jgi:hypothetical protein